MTPLRALAVVLCSLIMLAVVVWYSHQSPPAPCTDQGGAFLAALHGQQPCPAASGASR